MSDPTTKSALNVWAKERSKLFDQIMRPCRFCGGSDLDRVTLRSYNTEDRSRHVVKCVVCKARGPEAASAQEADAAWNCVMHTVYLRPGWLAEDIKRAGERLREWGIKL